MNQPLYHTDSHRMGRRSLHKDYRWPGIYHVTMTVSDRRQQPLGRIVGDVGKADGDPDAPRVELSEAGRMVEQELLQRIKDHYPMVEVQDYVIMPDHVHAIIAVKAAIVSKSGRQTHLGQVISGFKKGCSRRYWEMTGQAAVLQWGNPTAAGKQAMPATAAGTPATAAGKQAAPATATGTPAIATGGADSQRAAGSPQSYVKIPSRTTTGRQPLFSDGYVDVMPLQEGQLETQRVYIRNNPRNRLLRSLEHSSLHIQRGGIDTALRLPALQGYLQRECGSQYDADRWQMISSRLLQRDGMVDCDSFGDRDLLKGKLLPVVCHRKDLRDFDKQKAACLEAARQGAVLVSAHISKCEQEIINAVMDEGLPVVSIDDNGMGELYHPSERRMTLCAEQKLLIVTPWVFKYRSAEEDITVVECKTMNCVAQALCRQKDDWWKKT